VDLLEGGRALGGQAADASMLVVAKADGLGALHELDAIEDAAAHVAGTLERVDAVAGDQNRLLPRLEHARDALELGIAEQAAPDGGLRDERHVQLDELRLGRAALGPLRRLRVAGFL